MALTKIDDRGLKTPVDLLDNEKIRLGTGNDLEIYHDGSDSIITNTTGELILKDDSITFQAVSTTDTYLDAANGGAVELYYDNSKKLETTSAGVTITGSQSKIVGDLRFDNSTTADKDIYWDESEDRLNFFDSVKATFGNSDDLQIYHDGSHSYITDNGTGAIKLKGDDIRLENASGNNIVKVDGSVVELFYNGNKKLETTNAGGTLTGDWLLTSGGYLSFPDNVKAFFGTGSDLEIYHDGSNSYLQDAGTGALRIQSNDARIINAAGSEDMARFIENGAVELYYDNSKKLETISTGVQILGDLQLEGDDGTANSVYWDKSDYILKFKDSVNAEWGDGRDLRIYHNGTNDFIQSNGGYLKIQTDSLKIHDRSDDHPMITAVNDGSVELYYDNVKKFHTTTSGAQLTGHLFMDDSNKVQLGTSQDLQVWHDGTDSIIRNLTGETRIQCANIFEVTNYGNTETYIKASLNADVELYYNNSKKFETRDDGAEIIGNIFCDGHYEAADNSEIRLGTHDDLKLYHDGTNNILYANLSNNYALKLWNDTATSTGYGLGVICGTDDASGTNYAITVLDGNGSDQGSITFSGGTVTYGTFTAHHPCIVPDADNPSDNSNAYPYGTLLETISIEYSKDKNGADTERGIRYKVQKTQSANSRKVLGAYGSSMNDGPNDQTNLHQALVLGDGHILCNNAGGNIEVGDGICSSAAAGIGQKATVNPSMIIGIAQEAVTFTGSETKLVAVQYGLQQFIPWT